MLTSFFATAGYRGPGEMGWPRPPGIYDPEIGHKSFRDNVEEIEYADELGFDWVSISEHHYGFSMCPIPTVMGMHMADHVKRAKVAILGPAMPLNNPVRVAEELAMIDNLADGRLIVGLLRGTPNEYQVYSVKPEDTRDLTTEGMELVLKAWTETQPFSWEGRHYSYRMVSVWPRPLQQPIPPTYALGNSAETCEFAAINHLGIGVSFGTFAVNGRSTAYYRERCEAHGWTPKPEQMIYRGRILLTETDKEAEDILNTPRGEIGLRHQPAVQTTVRQLDPNPFHTGGAPLPGRNDHLEQPAGSQMPTFWGSPERVISQVKQCKEGIGAGVIDFMFTTGGGIENTKRTLKLFADEVMPKIRDL